MSQKLKYINKFDYVVKNKSYRDEFLAAMDTGWNLVESGEPTDFYIQKLNALLHIINEYDFDVVEIDHIERFAVFLGVLIALIRLTGEGVDKYRTLTYCSGPIINIMKALNRKSGYGKNYEPIRNVIQTILLELRNDEYNEKEVDSSRRQRMQAIFESTYYI